MPSRLARVGGALLWALMASGAAADETHGPVVVELFTSQGCAACPPADALLGELSMRDDVIALALHVDYWDYIGWEDVFARPEFTRRQQAYGHAAGSTVVYTPQMIVGGQERVVGVRPMAVAELIQAHRAQADPVTLSVEPRGGEYRVEAVAHMPPPRPTMVVQLVSFMPHAEVEIERGERAGTVGSHYNVVTSWQVVGEWDGTSPFTFALVPSSDRPHVVIVQEAGPGAILGAARIAQR
ncbi:DUF1223 domain-containing protein [Rhodobacterales bacterium HKCCSP123]|nr:DUF1223 domain-containing protein [Rhodobacterales bacterium HKCCSP123]